MASNMILCGLEVVTKDAAADVRLNDIPVATVGLPSGAGRAFIPVPAYIVRGPNRLAARVATVSAQASGDPRVDVRIAVFNDGDMYFSNAGHELARLNWSGPQARELLSRTFNAAFGPQHWSWSRCAAWSSPVEALADATHFVRDLVRAYFAADAVWIEAASPNKFADMALAFTSVPESEMKAQVTALIQTTPPQPVPNLPPPSPELCCDGRLLMLRGSDSRSYFRKEGRDGHQVETNMLLGKLDGKWQIIR